MRRSILYKGSTDGYSQLPGEPSPAKPAKSLPVKKIKSEDAMDRRKVLYHDADDLDMAEEMSEQLPEPVDMALSDDEKENPNPLLLFDAEPDYPPGLRICLTECELQKLGLPDDCDIGDILDCRVFAKVTMVTKSETGYCRVELQITHMSCEDENDEPGEFADEEGDGDE